MTVIMTWVWNHTRASIWMAILMHTSQDAFPNAILWPAFPSAAELSSEGYLYGYLGLALGLGAAALLLIAVTRGRLGAPAPENRVSFFLAISDAPFAPARPALGCSP